MKLYIKYMVSLRCKMIVAQELHNLNLHEICIDLGVIDIREEITKAQFSELKINLNKWGLELLDDKKAILIEKIKGVIVEMIHYTDEIPKTNFSDYLSEKLHYDYNYLSNIFMEVKGVTIQHYIIINKIEKVKELLLYDDLNLTEISYKLHYSSVAHLSNQFKKITGMNPSQYIKLKKKREDNLEDM